MKAKSSQSASPNLRLVSVYATSISVTLGGGHDQFRFEKGLSTFSRFKWSIATSETRGREMNGELLVHVPVTTQIRIGIKRSTPLPPSQPIPNEDLVGVIEISFGVEYMAPDMSLAAILDEPSALEIATDTLMRDIWPYWQEATTNLAMRAKLPQSRFPPYAVAAAGKNGPTSTPETKPSAKRRSTQRKTKSSSS